MEHELKSWPVFFQAVKSGQKTFEVRLNDRSFRVGDTLVLKEYVTIAGGHYTGREMTVKVTYLTHLDDVGITGYVAMQIERIDEA